MKNFVQSFLGLSDVFFDIITNCKSIAVHTFYLLLIPATVKNNTYDVVKGNNPVNITGLDKLAQGLYMLQVTNKEGNSIAMEKLIK